MTATASGQPAPWHVAYTKPRQENTAKDNLERQGFEVYLPLFKTFKKARQMADKAASATLLTFEPMFPRYIFFRPTSAQQSMGTLRSTRGVASVVMFGSTFAQVPLELLDSIRLAESLRNDAGLEEVSPYKPGSQVRLRDPALSGLECLVQEVSSERVTELLQILGWQKSLMEDFDQIEAL